MPTRRLAIDRNAPYIGVGSYAKISPATETTTTNRLIAVKQSRVPLRIRRPILRHESRILKLLQGHRHIPELYGYARVPHFEFIAMEMLGEPMDELASEPFPTPLRTVLLVAEQMLSAIQHVHSYGIIHRDIKPSNILAGLNDDANTLRLIDFGISARCSESATPIEQGDPVILRGSVMGTMCWASVHSHRGTELSRRDDLESLLYTLFYLLLGGLPWRKYSNSSGGTETACMARVRKVKERVSGAQLAKQHCLEPAFGRILDDVRALKFDEKPDYAGYREALREVWDRHGFEGSNLDWNPEPGTQEYTVGSSANIPPASKKLAHEMCQPGTLVSVRLLLAHTVAHIPETELTDSIWYHPDFDKRFVARPGIVIGSYVDQASGYMKANVVALKKRFPGAELEEGRVLEDFEPYFFPKIVTLTVVFDSPSSGSNSILRLSEEDTAQLTDSFYNAPWVPLSEQDSLADAQMRKHREAQDFFPLFAEILPLASSSDVDWDSNRAWYDDILEVVDWRDKDNGEWWDPQNPGPDNSYYGPDLDEWDDVQFERGTSVTLRETDGELEALDESIEKLELEWTRK